MPSSKIPSRAETLRRTVWPRASTRTPTVARKECRQILFDTARAIGNAHVLVNGKQGGVQWYRATVVHDLKAEMVAHPDGFDPALWDACGILRKRPAGRQRRAAHGQDAVRCNRGEFLTKMRAHHVLDQARLVGGR